MAQVDFLIVTALEEERDAVLSKLPGYQQLPPSDEDVRTYYSADVPTRFADSTTDTYKVVVVMLLGMGRVEAANATGDAIRRWKPRYVLMVGIAGGISDSGVILGDIIVSDQVVDYELQKITHEGATVRYSVHRADPRLHGFAQSLRPEQWQELIHERRPVDGSPNRAIGPIATGDKVIAFGEVLTQYRSTWPKLIGVEMEAGGVASAAFQAASQPGFFMVRGVSDLADENKDTDVVEDWRLYACDVAASYAIGLISNGPIPLRPLEGCHTSLLGLHTVVDIRGQIADVPTESHMATTKQFDTWIGLYYPYIHFRDEEWLRLAALYWDKMGRIVPHNYKTHDSDTVKQLTVDAGFIVNVAPKLYETSIVGNKFQQVLVHNRNALKAHYRLGSLLTNADQRSYHVGPFSVMFDLYSRRMSHNHTLPRSKADTKLAFVRVEKMDRNLLNALESANLAALTDDMEWIGMHPKLVAVYMTALAEEIASNRHYHPLTNDTDDHLAVSGYTIERLTQMLLRVNMVPSVPTTREMAAQMANISLRYVTPKNIGNIPLDKIIELRNKRSNEMTSFQDYLQKLVDETPWLYNIKDSDALVSHLDVLYKKLIKPQIDELEAICSSMNVDTVDRVLNVRIVASGLQPGRPITIGSDDIVLSLRPAIIEHKPKADLMASAAAYLFHVRERLHPKELGEQIMSAPA